MQLSPKATEIYNAVNKDNTKLGDLRKIAKEIKKDHDLAMELWSADGFFPRQLSILIMDKNLLTQEVIDGLTADMKQHPLKEQTHLIDWLFANQLTKSKKTIALIESWEHSEDSLQRRTFWYYQARLRWMGQTPPDNSDYLLTQVEKNITQEAPEVQWAMNFLAAWIGIYDESRRQQCIDIGINTGLYKEEKVPKNCTPNYLPEFIRIEVEKRK